MRTRLKTCPKRPTTLRKMSFRAELQFDIRRALFGQMRAGAVFLSGPRPSTEKW